MAYYTIIIIRIHQNSIGNCLGPYGMFEVKSPEAPEPLTVDVLPKLSVSFCSQHLLVAFMLTPTLNNPKP